MRVIFTEDALVGLSVAWLRKRRGFTQGHLAEYLDLTTSTMSRIEEGVSALSTRQLRLLCRCLELGPQQFYWTVSDLQGKLQAKGVEITDYSQDSYPGAVVLRTKAALELLG